MEDEKDIKGSPGMVDISSTQIILEQMKNCICKIKVDNKVGTGFFCKIPHGINKTMNCLITNNHIINEKYYDNINELILLINDEQETKVIDLNSKRRTYFSKEYDIALIELIKSDKIPKLLDIDSRLYDEEKAIKGKCEKESIYIIQYPEGNASVSYGILNNIKNNEIQHSCCTRNGSSGSPILYLKSNKVIGIHKNASKNENFNGGTLLKILLNNIKYKIKEKKDGINKTITISNDNYEGSWMDIFNKKIQDFEKDKEKIEKILKKLDEEIEEIAKNKINEIKYLHNEFKQFYGIKKESYYHKSFEDLFKVMESSLTGIPYEELIKSTDFCLNIFKEKIKKFLTYKNLGFVSWLDAEINLNKNRESIFNSFTCQLQYNSIKDKKYLGFLNGWLALETFGKMVIDNTYIYNTDEELDKTFDIVVNKIISYIRDKNNYGKNIKDSSGNFLKYKTNYEIIIDKFDKMNKSDTKLKEILKHDWTIFLIQFGIISPIKGRNFSWINNKLENK